MREKETLVPGVHKDLWLSIRTRIQAPNFRSTRRTGLLHEPHVPNILPSLSVVLHTHREDNCLYYFFSSLIKTKRLRPCFSHRCSQCYSQDLRIHYSEAVSICANCGYSNDYLDMSNSSYSQAVGPSTSIGSMVQTHPRQHMLCFYKRRNHFRYWLARMQGKETNRMTRAMIDSVEREISRCHDQPTYDSIRSALKRLGLQRYYNNTYSIQRSLIGHGLMELSRRQEEKLVKLFVKIQEPFAKHAGERVNMIYYSYLIKKLAEILHWPTVARSMPPLKSISKTRQLDILWANICLDLDFPFQRTV